MLQLNFSFFFCFESICIRVEEKRTSRNFPEEIARVITHANHVSGGRSIRLESPSLKFAACAYPPHYEVILTSPKSKRRHCAIGRRNEIVVFLSFEKRLGVIWNEGLSGMFYCGSVTKVTSLFW
ncbi:hypothetical protein CDAR_474521 [Caerostris darwini]|uniref:Secreted protein n=1 Tax=Caerostris darwini TaxID=1538125 RepID=A0AAV4PKI2_9ARAC|nr:hypothetical protein CDAR_474521 [Caerostris darwini]